MQQYNSSLSLLLLGACYHLRHNVAPVLHAAVLAEATGVVTMSARWYAAQYWCPIMTACVALKWITSLILTPTCQVDMVVPVAAAATNDEAAKQSALIQSAMF